MFQHWGNELPPVKVSDDLNFSFEMFGFFGRSFCFVCFYLHFIFILKCGALRWLGILGIRWLRQSVGLTLVEVDPERLPTGTL